MAEMGVVSVGRGSDHVTVSAPWSAIDEDGNVKSDFVHGDIKAQLEELNWYASALKSAR